MLSRKQTTGVVEHSFIYHGMTYILVDVSGQRNKWKKWIHHFDNVAAVIFFVAVSEYNQVDPVCENT